MTSVSPDPKGLRRNRLTIVAIALICIIPFVLAWVLARHPEWLRDREKGNYGQLIDPARPFDYGDFFAQALSNPKDMPEIKGHWVLVQIALSPDCAELCRETAHKTGQIRLMLNKEISRVRRLLLVEGRSEATGPFAEILAQDPTLLAAAMKPELKAKLEAATGAPLAEGTIVLMDPFANVMMWYAPGSDPYGILRDLQRLLRISQIG